MTDTIRKHTVLRTPGTGSPSAMTPSASTPRVGRGNTCTVVALWKAADWLSAIGTNTTRHATGRLPK